MKPSKQLLLANRAWADELTDENADFFSRQVAGRKPQFLWIGCSGSRTGPEQKTRSLPGLMVIHQNIGNLVVADDLNLMSVLHYAVDVLEVPNIVVCGHHGCGGMKAALRDGGETRRDRTDGVSHAGAADPVHRWLAPARASLAAHAEEIDALPEGEARVNRLVEVNVRDQLVNLMRTDTVRGAFARGADLTLYGWVYDVRDGLLKPLMEIDRHTRLEEVGRPEPVLV